MERQIEAGADAVMRVLAGHPEDVPPVWLMRQAGRYLPEYRAVREKAGSSASRGSPRPAAAAPGRRRRRFEMLSDNGSPYTARDTCIFASQLGLRPCFTLVKSPESNGISEAFVNTLKRDYVRVTPLSNAQVALDLVGGWIEDYNDNHPHSDALAPRVHSSSNRNRLSVRRKGGKITLIPNVEGTLDTPHVPFKPRGTSTSRTAQGSFERRISPTLRRAISIGLGQLT